MENSKIGNMKVRDIITVTLLSLCSAVIFFAFSFLYVIPVFILLFPVFVSLVQGIFFMMIGIKVPKKGAILLYAIISGVAGMNLIYALGSIAAGIIGEVLLAKTGYGKMKTLVIIYVIMQVINAFTSTVYPYAIAFESTKEMIAKTGADIALYEKASQMLAGASIALILAATGAAVLLGAFIWKQNDEKTRRKRITNGGCIPYESKEIRFIF